MGFPPPPLCVKKTKYNYCPNIVLAILHACSALALTLALAPALELTLPPTVSLRPLKAIREEVVWSHWVRRVPKASSFGNPLSGILFGNPFFGFSVKLFGHFRESFFRHFRESSFGNPFSGSFGNPFRESSFGNPFSGIFGNPFRESSFGNPFSVLFGNPLSGILFRAFSGILSGILFSRFRDSSSLKKSAGVFSEFGCVALKMQDSLFV